MIGTAHFAVKTMDLKWLCNSEKNAGAWYNSHHFSRVWDRTAFLPLNCNFPYVLTPELNSVLRWHFIWYKLGPLKWIALDCGCKLKAVTTTVEWFYLLREAEPYGVHSAHHHNHGGPLRLVSVTAGRARAPVFVKRRRLRNPRYLSETAGQTADCTERGGDVCVSNRWVSFFLIYF